MPEDNKKKVEGYIQSKDNTLSVVWLQRGQKIFPRQRIFVRDTKNFGVIGSYNQLNGRAVLSKPLKYVPLLGQYYCVLSEKDALAVEKESSNSGESLEEATSISTNSNYTSYVENEAASIREDDGRTDSSTTLSDSSGTDSSFVSSSSSGESYNSREERVETVSTSGGTSGGISVNSTTKQVENLAAASTLHQAGTSNQDNSGYHRGGNSAQNSGRNVHNNIANNLPSSNQIQAPTGTISQNNSVQTGLSIPNHGEMQPTNPLGRRLKATVSMNGSASNGRLNVGRAALNNNTSVAEPDKTALDREKDKNKDGLKNQMQKNAIRMIQNAVFPGGVSTDDTTGSQGQEKEEDSNDDATDSIDEPPKDDSPKKGKMKGTFTLKKVKIILFVVSVIFFIFILCFPIMAVSRFKTLSGIDSGGNVGDVDLASGGDPYLVNLYNNIKDIETEYSSRGKKFSGDLIASIYHILDSYSDTFGAQDMTNSMIRTIADKMFKESCSEDDEKKEHCTYGYSEELLREYLKNDLFPKYIKHHDIDDAVNEVFTYISDYANVTGNSGKNNFGGGCFIGGNTQASSGFFDHMSQEEYLNFMGPIANQVYAETGIFASVTLAQSIIEAGWGKNTPANSNNLFGIKCGGTGHPPSTWDGSCSSPVLTQEDYGGNGNYTTITSRFRSYKSVEEGILDHGALLVNGSPYVRTKVVEATSPQDQIARIKAAGYATDSKYVSKIINAINLYNLEKWDTASASNCSNTASGDFTTWKQSDSRWGSITIGNTTDTISRVGCLVTSLAMLIQKSGAFTTVSGEFNPGSFVEALNAVNGFDGANLLWDKVSLVAPSFTLVNKNVSLKGMSKSEKLSTIKGIVDQGYAAVLEVKGGGNNGTHYVAVDSVNGDTITMLDPGGHSTSNNLWKEFSWKNTSRIAYYKIN